MHRQPPKITPEQELELEGCAVLWERAYSEGGFRERDKNDPEGDEIVMRACQVADCPAMRKFIDIDPKSTAEDRKSFKVGRCSITRTIIYIV